jgi:antitoxin VapB
MSFYGYACQHASLFQGSSVLVQECRIARTEAKLLSFRFYLPDLFVFPCVLAQGKIYSMYMPKHMLAKKGGIMQTERHVKLFKNGRNQALRIPREYELPGDEAVIRKEGAKLIIEPVQHRSLLKVLAGWQPLTDDFPDLDADLLPLDDIEL